MKNKKALAMSFIAVIIIILVIMIIMLLFETRIGELYKNLMNKNICKSSVYSQDLATLKNIALPSDIKCPMQRIEIEEKDPEKIKKRLAKLYYDVCDEFGQGTLNLFGKRETTFCVIRGKISFKHKDIIIDDFAKYLAETEIPGKKLKYAEFCSGFKTERGDKIFDETHIGQLGKAIIDTNKEYVIMFIYVKGEEELKELASILIGTSKSHIGMYVGTGLIITGYALSSTFAGSVIGIPLAYLGGKMAMGGIVVTAVSGFMNWWTNEDIKMEWASFFLIREFDVEELKKLPCKYMPAEQREMLKT